MTDQTIVASNQAAPSTERSSQLSRFVDDVVAQLKAEMSGDMNVGRMPDKIGDYDLGNYEGAALAHYRGSDYRPAEGFGMPAQARTITFDIHLLLRALDGSFGAEVQIEDVRLALQGEQIQGSTPIAVQRDGLVQEKDGIWNYVVTFTASLPAVARRLTRSI